VIQNLIILAGCCVLELDAITCLLDERPVAAVILFIGAGWLATHLRWPPVMAAAADIATFARISPAIDAVMALAFAWYQEEE
jgi:hypothetical protein